MIFHVMWSVFMYEPPGGHLVDSEGSPGAVLNRWAEVLEIWFIEVLEGALSRDEVSFHICPTSFDPSGGSFNDPADSFKPLGRIT